MANVWKSSVLRNWKISERNWYRVNHVYGWLAPMLWVGFEFAVNFTFKDEIHERDLRGLGPSVFGKLY